MRTEDGVEPHSPKPHHSVYLGLGTNLGDRESNLRRAVVLLGRGVNILRVSPVYETDPVGYLDQPRFLNAVAQGTTALSPGTLLDLAKSIESEMGREPAARFGPRTIDIDILLYDDIVLETERLTIPHPRLSERTFVLIPLADLAPELRVPGVGRTVRALLDDVGGREGVRLFSAEGPISP